MPRAPGKWTGGTEAQGFFILGMGKYGAGELNYSSDIDIIALFDPEAPGLAERSRAVGILGADRAAAGDAACRSGRRDGYVFRTDLRLRPDPGATRVAISAPAALLYYESMGQNWERAALDQGARRRRRHRGGRSVHPRARALHLAKIPRLRGDRRHPFDQAAGACASRPRDGRGARPRHQARPRRHPRDRVFRADAAADRRRTRSRRCAARGRARCWRGSPRRAGSTKRRAPSSTRPMSSLRNGRAPAADGARRADASDAARREGAGADRPADALATTPTAFEARAARRSSRRVARRYSELFESADDLSTGGGSLVFTGGEDDPETLETLRQTRASPRRSIVTETVRGWHFGRFAAMRSTAARESLTEITPALLQAFSRAGNPDAAVRAFDSLLKALPAGAQLFALLRNNPDLLDLLATILSAAPRLAEIFARRPHVADALLDPSRAGWRGRARRGSRTALERSLAEARTLRGRARPRAALRRRAAIPDLRRTAERRASLRRRRGRRSPTSPRRSCARCSSAPQHEFAPPARPRPPAGKRRSSPSGGSAAAR